MNIFLIIVILMSPLLLDQVIAAPKIICTSEEAMRIEKEVSSLKDWHDIYASYKNFAHCNDINVVEVWGAYSDTIAHLLVKDWPHFDRLVYLTSLDQEFERFILSHVADETLPSDVLKDIIKNVRSHCSSKGKHLCRKIEVAAH